MAGATKQPAIVFLLLFLILLAATSNAFKSDELLLQEDDEFLDDSAHPRTRPRARLEPDLSSASESKSVQFSLEHSLDGVGFSSAGVFTARLKSWSHGGQTLTKLRFSRNALTEAEKEAFEGLLRNDDYYTIRLPSNMLDPAGKEYVVSSVKARCIVRDGLDEHFVLHTDGVNLLAVNYGSPGACQYPRTLKLPSKWSFNSYTLLKNSEQAPRAPTFTEQLLVADAGLGEGIKPPEKSFWAKYWMYMIPVGLIVMNVITTVMNMPEDPAAGQDGAQRAPNAAARRR